MKTQNGLQETLASLKGVYNEACKDYVDNLIELFNNIIDTITTNLVLNKIQNVQDANVHISHMIGKIEMLHTTVKNHMYPENEINHELKIYHELENDCRKVADWIHLNQSILRKFTMECE